MATAKEEDTPHRAHTWASSCPEGGGGGGRASGAEEAALRISPERQIRNLVMNFVLQHRSKVGYTLYGV